MAEFILPLLPLPPSSNNQYKSFVAKRGRSAGKIIHCSTKELLSFHSEVTTLLMTQPYTSIRFSTDLLSVWRTTSPPFVFRDFLDKWRQNRTSFAFHTVFVLPREMIVTKEGLPKKFDISNRIKALHDSVCTNYGIDDSWIWKFSVSRECAAIGDKPHSMVRLLVSE